VDEFRAKNAPASRAPKRKALLPFFWIHWMDRWAHAFGLDMLEITAQTQGQHEESLDYFKQSLTLYKAIGDKFNSIQITVRLGQTYAALRSNEEAKRLFLEAHTNAQTAKWTPIILNALVSFTITSSLQWRL